MKKPGRWPGLFVVRWEFRSAQDATDDATHEAAHRGRIRTAAAVLARSGRCLATATTTTAAVGATARRRLVLFIAAGGRCRLGRDDLRQQRLVLRLVEVAALRVAAGGLPAGDDVAGVRGEHAGHLGVEAEAVEAALHVAALALVEADLVLGELGRFFGEDGGIDAPRQVARRIGFVGAALPGGR